MYFGLLLLFIALPLVELAILIKIGQLIGFWWTIAIVVATAILGASVLHAQGFQVIRKVQASMARGEPPIAPVIDGAFLFLAGICLMTPGIITDSIGLLLLIPPVRGWIARRSIAKAMQSGGVHVHVFGDKASAADQAAQRRAKPDDAKANGQRPSSSGPVIEGEFERIDERTVDPNRNRKPS
jgi:UPF0716 protein FxsA